MQVLGLERANSTEFDDKTPDPVVIFMPEVVTSFYSLKGYSLNQMTNVLSFLYVPPGFKNTYGKHNETWLSKNVISESRLYHSKAVRNKLHHSI